MVLDPIKDKIKKKLVEVKLDEITLNNIAIIKRILSAQARKPVRDEDLV